VSCSSAIGSLVCIDSFAEAPSATWLCQVPPGYLRSKQAKKRRGWKVVRFARNESQRHRGI